jgi:hypothetical protein
MLTASRAGREHFQGIPTFIDSRAQLYGSAFSPARCEPFGLKISQILSGIDATLLFPSPQSVGLLDRLPEWKRIYADDVAVVHVRRTHPENADSLK